MRPRGQIKNLGNGKFRIAVPLKESPKGERPYHHETLHNSTPAKARKRLNSVLASVDDGSYFEPSRALLSDTIKQWLERKQRKEREGDIKFSTLQTYEIFARKHIAVLGNVQLRNLSVKLLQEFFDGLQDSGMKPSTMRLVYAPLKQALDLAVTYGQIKENPVLKIDLPRKNEPKKAKPFDEKEVFRFIQAAIQQPNDYIFLFALVTGTRPCEFIGMSYPNLELITEDGVERGLCRIAETVVKKRGHGWYFSSPKTEKGKRPICFPAFMYHTLMARKNAHLENLSRLGKAHQLVFTNSRGEPLDRDILGRGQFKRLLDRAEIPREGRTLYSLRRSLATLSSFLGEKSKTISTALGHASVHFTEDEYIDTLPVTQRMMSDRLENFLFRTTFALNSTDTVM